MVQKSGVHQLRLVVYPIIDKVLAPSQVVVRISPFSDLMCFFCSNLIVLLSAGILNGNSSLEDLKKTMHTVYKYSRKKQGVAQGNIVKFVGMLVSYLFPDQTHYQHLDHGSTYDTPLIHLRTVLI